MLEYLPLVPFAGIILSIALGPILFPRIWHLHYGKLAALWGAFAMFCMFHTAGFSFLSHAVAHVAFFEYIPFIAIVFSLYVISSGLEIHFDAQPTPALNTAILGVGAILANFLGTSGASMMLVRPFLRLNKDREHRVHQVIFFIFCVSNIGGCLTPLGDPPLFMGFLNGVDFFWTTKNLFLPYIFTLVVLLGLFFCLDSKYSTQEHKEFKLRSTRVQVANKVNFIFLAGVAALVLMSGVWKSGVCLNFFGMALPLQSIVRDIGLFAIALVSLIFTPLSKRKGHEFHWEPFIEVAKLFMGIFVTLVPVISFVKSHMNAIAPFMTIRTYFWGCGTLSAFLDNAPTYLLFFNLAGGDANYLMNEGAMILMAISLSSVFMGAITYVGNAPNFMVKSIASNYHIKMPSFFGYMGWSIAILVPIFFVMKVLFL